MTRPRNDDSKPLVASQFYDILDELAGVKNSAVDPLDESELDLVEPTPFSQEATDRFMHRLRGLRASEQRTPPGAKPKKWWRRRQFAAMIPICLLLIAAVPAYFYVWGRKDPRNLSYEDALNIVFDAHYPEESRNVAMARIATSIKRGISRITDRSTETEGLHSAAVNALGQIESMVDDPTPVTAGSKHPPGHMEGLIVTFQQTDPDSLPHQLLALPEFVEACQSGIHVLFKAQNQGGLLGQESRNRFLHIKRRLQRMK